MAARRVDRRVIAVVIGVLLLPVAVRAGASLAARGGRPPATTVAPGPSTPPTPAEAWDRALEDALRPLDSALRSLARSVDARSAGQQSDADLEAVLAEVGPQLAGVRSAVDRLGPHPSDPFVQVLVGHMAELYGLSVDAHRLSLRAGDRAVGRQYDLLGRRLRILGDRAFDRARERTHAPLASTPELRLALPAEVPDWTRLEVAAGPPLEPSDPNRSDALPLERAAARPSQDEAAWRTAVQALGAPTTGDVRATLDQPAALAGLARRLVGAAEGLRSEPVPAGDRGRADRLALGWLVRADAARAAQLVALAAEGADAGRAVTGALLAMGESTALSER